MKKKQYNNVTHVLTALCLWCMLCACIKENPTDNSEIINHVEVGDPVPAFTVSDGGEDIFSTDSLKGRRTLLVLFNTGCKDCQRELPIVNQVWKSIHDNVGYQVITIARQETLSSVTSYWDEKKFTMPFYLDPDRSVFTLFANSTIPRLYIVDSKGIVTWMAVETLNGKTAEDLLQLLYD